MGKILGINLGNAFATVCCFNKNGVPEYIENFFGEKKTSTAIGRGMKDFFVGTYALEQGYLMPESICKYLPLHLDEPDRIFEIGCDSEEYRVSELVGVIFKSILTDPILSENEIDGVIVSCHFGGGDEKKKVIAKALQDLVLNTGAKVLPLKIVDEDVAAAVYYNNDYFEKKKTIILYDMGETKFTCSQITVEGRKYEVVRRTGDYILGGKEYDEALRNYILEEFCRETGFDFDEVREDIDVSERLNENIEKVKRQLTAKDNTYIALSHNDIRARIDVTREKFEEITGHLTESTFKLIEKNFGRDVIDGTDEAIFIGGATKMPQIKKYAEKFFKCKVTFPADGDFASAYGALLCADENFGVDCYKPDNSNIEGVYFGIENPVEVPYAPLIDWFHPGFGIEVKIDGKPMVLTFIEQDCITPVSVTKRISVNGKNEIVKELVLKVYDCYSGKDNLCDIDLCSDCYEPVYIRFKERTSGDDIVSINMSFNGRSSPVLKIFVERTFEYFEYEMKYKASYCKSSVHKLTLG